MGMKKLLTAGTLLLTAASLTGCGMLPYLFDTAGHDAQEETSWENSTLMYHQPLDCNLSGSDEPQVLNVHLEGEYAVDTSIENLLHIHVLHTDLVGRFGCPVEIRASEFSEGTLTFSYDPENSRNVPPENLIVLHYNEEDDFYDTVDSALDTDAHTITASITEPGVYMLADAYVWYGAWGMDVSDYAHDTVYRDDEFGFEITVPEEIRLRYVSDYLKDDEEGRCKTVLECESNDRITVGIEFIERPAYDSALDFANKIAEVLHDNDSLVETGIIRNPPATVGYWFHASFDERSHSVNCFYPLNDTQYIHVWYGFTDADDLEKVMDSLNSFRFVAAPTLPEVMPKEDITQDPDYPDIPPAIEPEELEITFPDGFFADPVDMRLHRETDMDGREICRKWLLFTNHEKCSKAGNHVYFGAFFDLMLTGDTARADAQRCKARELEDEDSLLTEETEIDMPCGTKGYLFSIKKADGIYPASYLYGFYEIPDGIGGVHEQYVRIEFYLNEPLSDEDYQAYWECLRSVTIRQ